MAHHPSSSGLPISSAAEFLFASLIMPDVRYQGDDPRHCHDHHEIILPERGCYRVRIGPQDLLEASPGQVLLMPAGCEHWPDFSSGRRWQTVGWRGACPAAGAQVFADRDRRLLGLCLWLGDCNLERQPALVGHRRQILALVLSQIGLLLDQDFGQGGLVQRMCRHLRWCNDRINGPAAAAGAVGLSAVHGRRLFKQAMGMTPSIYLQRCRCERAVILLRDTRLGLQAIAKEVGVGSADHLTRLLKRHLGLTARALRRSVPEAGPAGIPREGGLRLDRSVPP